MLHAWAWIQPVNSGHRTVRLCADGWRYIFWVVNSMAENIWTIIAYAACAGVWIRLLPWFHITFRQHRKNLAGNSPLVSIIVPVRNEAASIARLLESLMHLTYTPVEIIVVDDGSEDHTRQVAEQYGVIVISAPPKPAGWVGKSWACYTGSQHASGELLLFTDADTIHTPESLKYALYFMRRTKSEFISAPAFHLAKSWWEKIIGPFFCILTTGASPYDRISTRNAYALGQYLLIEAKSYARMGTHSAVSHEIADDAALVRLALNHTVRYRMYKGSPLCKIQMYRSFSEFFTGWTRIIRLGFQELRLSITVYTLLPILALNLQNLFISFSMVEWTPAVLTLICFSIVQQKLGKFNAAGVILFPVGVALFLAVALNAVIGKVTSTPIRWKGRIYQAQNSALD